MIFEKRCGASEAGRYRNAVPGNMHCRGEAPGPTVVGHCDGTERWSLLDEWMEILRVNGGKSCSMAPSLAHSAFTGGSSEGERDLSVTL